MAAGRALVVDDEEGIRVLCRVNLELGGFTVFEPVTAPKPSRWPAASGPT
ncbi:MAG: hypothetical protein H0W70_12965 [Actinobacteria bacterium]|nr:hypothetical protein [Actinomycetota bacterium]